MKPIADARAIQAKIGAFARPLATRRHTAQRFRHTGERTCRSSIPVRILVNALPGGWPKNRLPGCPQSTATAHRNQSLWDGQTAIIYSQPGQAKIRNVERTGRASLNFNSDFHGGDVVVLTGTAEIEPSAPAADQNPAYVEKYADGIASINMTPESFAAAYSVPIRLTPAKLRGF